MRKWAILLALFPCVCWAGSFTKVRDGEYSFEGMMLPEDATAYRKLFVENSGPFTVTVDSQGGWLSAGVEMAKVTSILHEQVTLVAKECFSAAAMWVMADPGYKFHDDKSLIAWHCAWLSKGGVPQPQTIGETSRLAIIIWESMRTTMEPTAARLIFDAMCEARDWKGINAFVVFRKGKPMATGFWTPEKWEWMDETSSPISRLVPAPFVG